MNIIAPICEAFAPKFLLAGAVGLALSLQTSRAAATPGVGDAAPNFTLSTLEDKPMVLKQLTAKKSVVLAPTRTAAAYHQPWGHDFLSHYLGKKSSFP